jgi:hypothetical protein
MVMNIIQRLVVILIKPSNYDERGFVRRYRKWLIPSNSAVLVDFLLVRHLR